MFGFGSIRCSSPSGTTLPIRIRDTSGTVIVEGISGREIDVSPGLYHVGALLPDGSELLAPELVEVTAGMIVEAILQEVEQAIPLASAPMPAGDAPNAPAPLMARRWRGDWLAAAARLDDPGTLDESCFVGESYEFHTDQPVVIGRDFKVDDVLVVEYGGKRSIHVMPLDECIVCVDESPAARSIGVRARIVGEIAELCFSSPISPDTNAFMEFIDHGLLTESRAISSDFVMHGEVALRSAQSSLLRAVLGAYVLLRANQLNGLDRWIDQLIEASPELPDVYALQAELHARIGDHDGAVDALRRSLDKPCPWFRSGVSYSLERLRLYIDVHREPKVGFTLQGNDLDRFIERKTLLARAATHLDTGAVFATFR